MNEQNEINFLSQEEWRNSKIPQIGKEAWITVYDSLNSEVERSGVYCALIPNEMIKESLSRVSWDLSKGDGLPACSVHYEEEEQIVTYYRFGGISDWAEPLIFLRTFHGVHPAYLEVSEEFRHFHNLYFKENGSSLIKATEVGDEEIVGRLSDNKVELRLREIRQFLAIKDMHLAVFFDNVRYTKLGKSIIETHVKPIKFNEDLTSYVLDVVPERELFSKDATGFSRLVGKKLIPPLPKEKSGRYPYNENEEEEFEDFIIGVDENSDPITYTCNPDELANYFGKNPHAPHYLTPVFFKREVLAKYYSDSSRFIVEDGSIRCGALWLLRIDNNHEKHVVVYLGDLGRDISYTEQKYWKSFNVAPDGGVSTVQFKRGFLGEFADPESPDLLFKLLFQLLNEKWEKQFGWKLFLPLTPEDQHFYDTLRIPVSNSQSEFDSQVLALTKVIIDSLNEKQITSALGGSLENEKGISKFERFLIAKNFTNYEPHISFLRDLQELRSKGTAHRKGSSYPKVIEKYDTDKKGFIGSFRDVVKQANELLKFLEQIP